MIKKYIDNKIQKQIEKQMNSLGSTRKAQEKTTVGLARVVSIKGDKYEVELPDGSKKLINPGNTSIPPNGYIFIAGDFQLF